MTVAAVSCNRPLPLSQSEAVLWSIGEGGDVPHNITESPFHPFGAGIVRVFPLQFYFGGEPSLEPDVSQVIWTLNRSEPSPNGWVFFLIVEKGQRPLKRRRGGGWSFLQGQPLQAEEQVLSHQDLLNWIM